MANIGELVATAKLDIAPFSQNVAQLKRHVGSVETQLNALEKSTSRHGMSMRNMKTMYSSTSSALKTYEGILSKQTARYNEIKGSVSDWNNATEKQKSALLGAERAMSQSMAKVAELQAKLASISNMANPFARLGTYAQQMGDKFKTVGQNINGLGNTLTKSLTVPMAAGAGYAIKAAIDYESAFAGVRKTVNATEPEFDALNNQIRDMAKTMPASAVEIANVAEAAGQLGVPVGSIKGFTETMINLGVATNMSSDEAATSIAKIGNIMQVQGEDLDEWSSRFGSTVVYLGNNFATTERDITDMANRLASAGSIAGLTEPEILALATAMSSVGIESEAGGTAMSQTLSGISNAVSEGGDALQIYADTAGMTADQFATAWKEKPAEALQAFIKGLGEIKENGGDVNKVLDDLGLSGIRQSNMLKSLGLASDTLGKALKGANQAWNENTALTKEAETRYKTTESQLQILKNQVTDLAIEFGGPLLKALNSGIQAIKPWLGNLAKMAEAFSKMSESQQQSIIKWGLFVAAAGPALKIFGSLTSGVGGAISTFGKISGGIGKLVEGFKGLKAGTGFFKAFADGAGVAESAAGGLVTQAGLLGNPATWGVLLGGAVLTGLVVLGQNAENARHDLEEFGTKLSDTQRVELEGFRGKVIETQAAIANFNGSEKSVENLRQSFKALGDEVGENINKRLNELQESLEKGSITQEQYDRGKNYQENRAENVKAMMAEIEAIYQRHNGRVEALSAEERDIVMRYQRELTQQKVESMNLSKEQEKAVLSALNGDISKLNTTQLEEMQKTFKGLMDQETKSYQSQIDEINKNYENHALTKTEYELQMAAAENEHKQVMEGLGKTYKDVAEKLESSTTVYDEAGNAYEASNNAIYEAQKTLESYGLKWDEVGSAVKNNATAAMQTQKLLAQNTAEMSEETRKANEAWKNLVFDDKEGRIKTNAVEVIAESMQTEEGWNSIQLIEKDANINSNAKAMIAAAMMEAGKWDSYDPEKKELLLENAAGLKALTESEKGLAEWNALDPNVKNLILTDDEVLNNADAAKTVVAEWNALTPEAKELFAKNLTGPDVELAQKTIDSLKGKKVDLNGDNRVGTATSEAQIMIDRVQQKQAVLLKALNDTQSGTSSASRDINAVKQNRPVSIKGQNDTGPAVAGAAANLNSLQNKTVNVYANDYASGVLANVAAQAAAVPRNIMVNARALFTRNEKGTAYHRGGLAMVNDQKGPVYKEMITLPNGQSFVPEGRNVMLNLPRGSKVLTASRTKRLIPAYKDGIGWEDTKISRISTRFAEIRQESTETKSQRAGDLTSLEEAIRQISVSSPEITVNITGNILKEEADVNRLAEQVARKISDELERQNRLKGAIA